MKEFILNYCSLCFRPYAFSLVLLLVPILLVPILIRALALADSLSFSTFLASNGRGWALRNDVALVTGQLVMEYIGEVITGQEVDLRMEEYEGKRHTYLLKLNHDEFIDSSRCLIACVCGVSCACIYARMRVHMHAYLLTCIHTYRHTNMHTYIHTYLHTHKYIYMHSHIVLMQIHTCIDSYAHACMHAYTHIFIYTHLNAGAATQMSMLVLPLKCAANEVYEVSDDFIFAAHRKTIRRECYTCT